MTYTSIQIEIPLSKRKLVLLLVAAMAFVLLGIWLIFTAPGLTDWAAKHPLYPRVIGMVAVLFFGGCAVYIVRKLSDNKPGLVIDKMGIIDNSSGVAAGLILWTDITSIDVLEIHRQKLLMLQVKNPQEYIDRQTNGLKKKLMQLNFNRYGTPLSITSNTLQIKFDELHRILNHRLTASRQ